MAKAVAWIAILVASNLTNILWRTTLHSEVPLWTLAVRIGILVLLLGLSLSLPGLRSLRGYLVALVALSAGFLLEDLIYQNGTLVAWIATAPWRDPVIVSSTLKFLPAAAMAITVLGLSRRDLFLIKGDLAAPSRVPFLSWTLPWTTLGIVLILIFGAGLAVYLTFALRPNFQMFQRIAAWAPVILIFSAVNAFNEEFVFRSVLLARLEPVVGGEQALWMTSVRFGLGHWFGNPSGPIGTIGATILGLFLGKSMLETRGFLWAWLIHAVQDVVIFAFLIMARP